jgi:hypothetical protein
MKGVLGWSRGGLDLILPANLHIALYAMDPYVMGAAGITALSLECWILCPQDLATPGTPSARGTQGFSSLALCSRSLFLRHQLASSLTSVCISVASAPCCFFPDVFWSSLAAGPVTVIIFFAADSSVLSSCYQLSLFSS